MFLIEFYYKGNPITSQVNENDLMETIFQNFCGKANIDINSVHFLYGGNKVKEKLKLNEIVNKEDKERKKMNILVLEDYSMIDQKSLKEIKQVVCPICKEDCRLQINNYKVKLFECIKGHPSNTFLLNEYALTTNIEESDIKCGNSETDQMLAGYGDDKERWEEVKNQEVEEQNKLEYVRVTHNYLPQETTILDLHLYRSQEI